jgi:nanoRNase/pAp phosphatase (c-di-AMP/oligoRNAs hydrolase)
LYKYLIEFAEENFDDSDVLRILHSDTDNKKTYSLRSLKEHVKVDDMARFYDGNGHEKAAGYSINNITI